MYKKRLILKITDIVNASEFLDNNIIKISKNLNQEKLEKLLIIIYDFFVKELSMSEEEKTNAFKIKNTFLKQTQNIFKKAPLEFIKKIESKEKNMELKEILI
jgi:hypothetical protein